VVLNEDISVGNVIEGVRFIDPFTVDFQIEAWV
jgi:hypothetical protein